MKKILKRLNCFILVLTLSISSGLCACNGSVYVDDPGGMDSSWQIIEKMIKDRKYDEAIEMARQRDFNDIMDHLLGTLGRQDIVKKLDELISRLCRGYGKVDDDAFSVKVAYFLCDNYKEFLTPNEPKIVILIAILLGWDYYKAYEWLRRCTS